MIRIRKIQIPSLPTKNDRRLYIYLPRDYRRTERRFPVLYMFDGHNVFYDSHATYGKSWGMKEYLEKTALPIILVAVECNPEGNRRLSEYSPWDFRAGRLGVIPGEGRKTMDWIVGELKPMIDREFRTMPGREHTLIAGSSMGGLMALWAAVEYNAVFSRAAALSPTLWVGKRQTAELIRAAALEKPTRVYMDYGGGEAEEDAPERLPEIMFATARHLTASGAEVAARLVPSALHSEAYWEKRIPVFMDYLLGRE